MYTYYNNNNVCLHILILIIIIIIRADEIFSMQNIKWCDYYGMFV